MEVERAAILAVLPREEPVGDRQMEVRMPIQARPEAVQKGPGAEEGDRWRGRDCKCGDNLTRMAVKLQPYARWNSN